MSFRYVFEFNINWMKCSSTITVTGTGDDETSLAPCSMP